ncbi:aromatic amino acid transporter [uncultured Desulfovibrio sp.]|uniref:aromatic amino acid transporter n=1 Tax=uncultured Desulfovibrio sp. TaxID=167968 RepID=UPI002625041D|nr:aromatic amino acid transporter [uncultured Desulfovibrio sp.]
MRSLFGPGFQKVMGGSMVVAGTAIGAGMLGLPMISAGMWFNWSLVVIFVSWFCMLRASQAILEVNLCFEPGDSLHTMVNRTLGPAWSLINGLAVAFVLYTLVYAYVSGGGSVVQQAMQSSWGYTPPRVLTSLIFSLLLTACVWWSSQVVDRLSVVLMGGMIITFFLSVGGMIGNADMGHIWGEQADSGEFIFLFGAVSTYLTSFCFHASVPSLIKYLGKEPRIINACLRNGTFIALLCYLVWIIAADGILDREAFRAVIAAGGNVGDLVQASGSSLGYIIQKMLEFFALFAIATSFLGAGLGLFDYMADLCNFDNSRRGRTLTMLVTFLPPMLGGLIWPDGFLAAIGWAGLAAAIWSVIVPAMLLHVSRRKGGEALYRMPGASWAIPLLLVYGIGAAVCHTLTVLNYLPAFK